MLSLFGGRDDLLCQVRLHGLIAAVAGAGCDDCERVSGVDSPVRGQCHEGTRQQSAAYEIVSDPTVGGNLHGSHNLVIVGYPSTGGSITARETFTVQ